MSHPLPEHDYTEQTTGEQYPGVKARKKKIAKKMHVGKYLSASPKHLIDQINKRPGESAYSHLKRLLD